MARKALSEIKLLGKVDIIASTGIRNGADVAKALALGANAVMINESALIALNYPPVIHGANKSSDYLQKEQFDATGERLAKFINSMTMELALLARSLGKGDVHSLEFEDLSALTIEASMMTGIRLCGE
jgi:glutamate synthase domain-containing protein 2